MIPTGLCEEIYVQFTPPINNGHTKYDDNIRIHCTGDTINIPIFAFPVINSKRKQEIPKLIDFGDKTRIRSTNLKQFHIDSNCPIDFRYVI